MRASLSLCTVIALILRGATASEQCASPRTEPVVVNGRNLTIGGQSIFLKGVAWNPYAVGTDPK